ncbi:MAG: hypothetical protein K2X11_03360, partial [Acetobacteraceae bacterium]|nr:hypothetical protein [Acetobacteraceae bacterium]
MDHLVLSAFPVAAPAIVAEPEGGRLFALALSLACCDADAPARTGEAGPVPHRPAGAGGVAMQASAVVHPSTPHPPRPAAGHAPA